MQVRLVCIGDDGDHYAKTVTVPPCNEQVCIGPVPLYLHDGRPATVYNLLSAQTDRYLFEDEFGLFYVNSEQVVDIQLI